MCEEKEAAVSVLQRLEAGFVGVATWLVAVLAPVPTAYAIYRSALVHLDFPQWVALALAVVIEGLGLATLYVAIMLYSYEQERGARDPSAQKHFYFSLGLAGMYLALALALVAVVDVVPAAAMVAKFLLPFLSLTSGCLVILRADHSRRVDVVAQAKADRKAARQSSKPSRKAISKTSSKTSRNVQVDVQADAQGGVQRDVIDKVNGGRLARKARLLDELEALYRESGGQLSASETAQGLGIGRSTFYTYLDELRAAGRVNGREVAG